MLDHVHIFHRGGLVLWSKSFVPSPSPVRALIEDGLIEEKSSSIHETMEIQLGSYSLQWNLSNEFGLIFVVAYQRILQLSYITDLLESMKSLFTSLYSSVLDTTFNSWIVPPQDLLTEGLKGLFKGWDQSFHQLLKELERLADRRRRGGLNEKKSIRLENEALEKEAQESSSSDQQPSALTTATDAETISRNIAALKARKKKKNVKSSIIRGESRSDTNTDSPSVAQSKGINNNKKTARKWEDGKITAKDIAEYDFSEDVLQDDGSTSLQSTLINDISIGTRNQKGFYEVADYDQNKAPDKKKTENQTPSSLFSKLSSAIGIFSGGQKSGPAILTQTDVQPMIEQIQLHLMKKNVAREIAMRICERIQVELIGKKLSDRSTNGLKKLINESLEISLTKILTPRTSTDILTDVYQKQQHQKQINFSRPEGPTRPYVITFVGVNGVGKSTNLSKIAFWLLQNRLRVLIAACDTFRSGAVEQLRTHVLNLGKLDGSNLLDRSPDQKASTQAQLKNIQLFEKGYGKDAAGIAKEAIQFAQSDGFEVVLIDTAGRMQDNEPLMRALGKLVAVNQPDKILFVGEALAGNEAVDQLSKFDKALKTFSGLSSQVARGIDGIILTKFDTIDDKVGAALSMTYTINQPIYFVGTGQTYTDLKNLKVNHVVDALMR